MGVGDVGEHLARKNHGARLVYARGNAVLDGDRQIGRLELKDAVLRLDENAREDRQSGRSGDALLHNGEGIGKR